jgi:hypothetical protein
MNVHVLEKLWAISRVLLYISRTPQHVFMLALVNRAFRECMLEYKLGHSIFDRVFDARNEGQGEDDVQTVWRQAATIMVKQETEQPTLLSPELFGEMLAAMENENARAAVEYAQVQTAERDAAWRASSRFCDGWREEYAQRYARFVAEKPLPASVSARNRLAQTRGTLFVAFRGCQHTIDWTRYVVVAERVVLNFGNKNLSGNVDLTKLPQSLQVLYLTNNQLRGTPDLTQLPQSLRELWLQSNKYTGTPDLTQLPQSLQELSLEENEFSGTPDLTHLPQSLQKLWLMNNKFTGTPDLTQLPQSLQVLRIGSNTFSGTVQRSMLPQSLTLFTFNSGLTEIP